MGARRAVYHRIGRPRLAAWPCRRRGREDLKLRHRCGTLPVRRSEAIGSRITTTDDHDMLARHVERRLIHVTSDNPVRERQELHCLVDPAQFSSGYVEVPPHGRADRDDDGVVAAAEVIGSDVDTDIGPRAKLDPLGFHLGQAAVEMVLFHLELRDPVAEQASDAVGPLEHRNGMARPCELLCRGKARRTGADDRNGLAGQPLRALGGDPTLVPRPVDDRHLDLLDRHRIGVDPEHARGLARRRAQAAGELREVVRRMKSLARSPPIVAKDEVVPLRDEVSERAAAMAERDAAVHAASGLLLDLRLAELLIDLTPVLEPYVNRPSRRKLPVCRHEALRVSHGRLPSREPSDRALARPLVPATASRACSPLASPW
ncbi:unannotated protein [freshwater metagenome]|uniref:Unannotated protein n=1 Tax=freshwater metagenome TaxID=449393 RepID=A0A6J6SNV4_9ZZZZ